MKTKRKSYRVQLNITLNDEQIVFVKENFKTMTNIKIAERIGVTYNKLMQNIRLLELGKYKKPTKIVNIEDYFDIEAFAKSYYY